MVNFISFDRDELTAGDSEFDLAVGAIGNRVAKLLALLLDCFAKMRTWLRYKGPLQGFQGD